ncbi:uncharacterized protein IUM83_12356 [Phytophthora cinnamomi]|uniref:uncharacterized protein n=1 Tax=Phytophthora cinnamomi TaxID=4785 RepID=UPI00355A4DD1|nr:hypothetical protein IUM83_12356 [Phytophthora cinnamomi]
MFIAKNKSADPGNNPTRMWLTLLYANTFLGDALGHLLSDSPQSWNGYSEALRAIDYQSPEWTFALASALNSSDRITGHEQREAGRTSRREPSRGPAVPDDIRRLLPINRRGQEPCLFNVAGLRCSVGEAPAITVAIGVAPTTGPTGFRLACRSGWARHTVA